MHSFLCIIEAKFCQLKAIFSMIIHMSILNSFSLCSIFPLQLRISLFRNFMYSSFVTDDEILRVWTYHLCYHRKGFVTLTSINHNQIVTN